MKRNLHWVVAGLLAAGLSGTQAHESKFGYVVEPTVPAKGEVEVEQWITGRFGRHDGAYSAWDFREEIEYGLTDKLGTAFYLNFTDEFQARGPNGEGGVSGGMDFQGISTELKYQLTDADLQPVGSLLYLEYTTDGSSHELEEKLVLSVERSHWTFAGNIITEQEWEYEDGSKLEEGALEFQAGISHPVCRNWSAGVEARHKIKYADAALSQREYGATFAGPNVMYSQGNVRVILAVLPQIHGTSGDDSGNLQLDEEERLQTRLVASYEF